ncbi:hypothetical protein KDD17_01805 [Sulfitobacter albidus]|uniref:Uncharacterized protein n=1 Tax=Sulfitobacter albidus TaxID=2829501 RepID=A0A975JE45_9RHOB|nr:hypothetical protein [Sulfitobacter albidus]QUJ76822.1 hypothetical protein KDD17_01805 [Sulfitobacter albidus]
MIKALSDYLSRMFSGSTDSSLAEWEATYAEDLAYLNALSRRETDADKPDAA